MSLVPQTPTELAVDAARTVLAGAWQRIFGEPPDNNQLALVMAQTGLETGQWRKMLNFNFGNLIPAGSPNDFWDGDFYELRGEKFRAYKSADDGALDYLRLLNNRADWRTTVKTGDPVRFNRALVSSPGGKYYTADPAQYGATLERLFKQFGGKTSVSLFMLGSGLGFGWLLWKLFKR